MNQWPNGQSNGMFSQNASGHLNPAAMYNNLANPNQFDQYSQGLQNGNGSTPTPTAFNQTFNPASVIPAKRPHDGGMAGSPQQSQMSRSQTPSYAFPNQQAGGSQFPNAPTPYQHLQQPASNNATPSPTMSNQQFRPPQQTRMNNASPSPFPQQQQQQPQQGNFTGQMPPSTPQQHNQQPGMQQQQQGGMVSWNQGIGMSTNNMNAGVSMAPQMNNMMSQANAQANAQRIYQMKLQQQQDAMRRSGMVPPRPAGQQGAINNMGSQQPGAQMANGQNTNPAATTNHQQKRAQFFKALQASAMQTGRQFVPNPTVGNRPIDLYMLFNVVASAQGAANVERMGQWQIVANKFGLPPSQFPNAGEELKQLYIRDVGNYERAWFNMKVQQKREQAREHAHQMAGLGGPTPSTPSRTMQPPNQQNQFAQFQQGIQAQQQAQATPVQIPAQLQQNGMSTPEQLMHHRRNSSIQRPPQMTPQAGVASVAAASPGSGQKVQRSPSARQEGGGAVMKSDEPQSSNYVPNFRSMELDGGYNIPALHELGTVISRFLPNMPTVDEMGIIDMRAIGLSLASGIHSEVRYALDALVIVSRDERIHFELAQCEDLIEYVVDCAEEQTETLSEDAAEVSDALDLPSYEDIMRGARAENDTLQDVPAFGTHPYELDRAADRLIAITTIMRNMSFFEHNHVLLTSARLIKWLSNTIRLLGTRNLLLRTLLNTLDFYKDIITFLSNITQSLELPGRDDALHVLHFLLAFAPQPAPNYADDPGSVTFTHFQPAVHRYLPPAVDCLAKLLARQDPNRQLYKSIFTASSSSLAASESPLDLLTRAFALSISILPDRTKGSLSNSHQLRIVEARKSYLCQGMLAADILTTLVPGNDTALARAWIESEDGWVIGLLNLASLLSVDRTPPGGPKVRDLGHDTESFKLITHRALSMMKRLAEKAGRGSMHRALAPGMQNGNAVNGDAVTNDEEAELSAPKWEGVPHGHAILGALMMPNTDKVALGLLCSLHEMAMQQ
ncbi:hypothetical protein LTS14_002596 [Recurvomyces mirabilis]|uniref:uncharacterized protein n=1 Tax=Recurvomyces mirabilis TaxID=574656 RepID=UPI002DE0499A|nr:hypothetical protein LTS14_002596 [Recurvomyces mirabilis]